MNYLSLITASLLVSDWLGHCLNSKCHFPAIFTLIDTSTDDYYVALKASNVRYLTINEQLKYLETNNLRNLTINDKLSKNANFSPYKC